ncbi:MAG: LCP family protein [Lachnospiraceae bacterium]
MTQNKKKKTNKRNVAVIVTCAVLALILILVLCVYLFIKSYVNKINSVDREEWNNITVDDSTIETDEDGNPVNNPTMPSEIDSQGAENFGNGEGVGKDYVKSYVFIGTDNRHFENILTNPGNSDSIIVVSINSKTKKIYLTSIMRDTAAYIQYTDQMKASHSNWKDGYNKINLANARGGPEFLLDIIEGNFKIKVDDYVLVDFYNLIDIIDILGGIPMTLTDAEAEAANNYIRDMDFDRGVENWETANTLSGGGNLILNGVQAVGYARERQTAGSDFNRTNRQRAVIEQIIIKAKSMSLSQLDELADTILPKVYTNMTPDQIIGMIPDAVTYLGYEVEQIRIPFDNMYQSVDGNLLPDYEATIEKLQSIIFATE